MRKLPFIASLIVCTIVILGAALPARAAFYVQQTNLYFTNTVAASATLTYADTNRLGLTAYRFLTISATWSGSNTNTNTVTCSFVSSPDGSNWGIVPAFSLSGTSYGTNLSLLTTQLDVSGVAYLKPFQIVNGCTNSLTNFSTLSWVKEYPRN